MRLNFVNQTEVPLELQLPSRNGTKCDTLIALAHTSVTISLSGLTKGTLSLRACYSCNDEKSEANSAHLAGNLSASIPLMMGSKWKTVRVQEQCPWRIYRSRVSTSSGRKYFYAKLIYFSVQINRKHYKLTVLPRRDTASFLSDMPDSVPLSALVLPGASQPSFRAAAQPDKLYHRHS